jgi:hypothetical protein
MRAIHLSLVIVGTFVVSGCQAKLTVSKSFTLPGDDGIVQIWEMPAQPSVQSIKVAVTVKSGPNVDVFVANASDIGEEIHGSPKEKKAWEEKGFGFKRDVKSETVTVKVPANVKYKVLIMQVDEAKGKSELEVKITN